MGSKTKAFGGETQLLPNVIQINPNKSKFDIPVQVFG
jgi:hypothetical protein